jgi:hypothetical protein
MLNTHDVKLARRLYEFLSPGDVLLGDRAFCSYADLVFIKNCQADAVFRKHQARKLSYNDEENLLVRTISKLYGTNLKLALKV